MGGQYKISLKFSFSKEGKRKYFDLEDFISEIDNNFLRKIFDYDSEDFFITDINEDNYEKLTCTIDDIKNKYENMSGSEIKMDLIIFIRNKLKVLNYIYKDCTIDLYQLFMSPTISQKFKFKIKLFIKSIDVKQSKLDKFCFKEVEDYHTKKMVPRYKKFAEDICVGREWKLSSIKYEESYLKFKIITSKNNINVLVEEDLIIDILETSFEDGIYGGSYYVYSKEKCPEGGHFEYNLDCRKKENISVKEILV